VSNDRDLGVWSELSAPVADGRRRERASSKTGFCVHGERSLR
jgi:hypothetical protein